MIITSIKNRTENWKTAKAFASSENNNRYRLVQHLGDEKTSPNDEFPMRLFWRGMRDLRHGCPNFCTSDVLAKRFDARFSELHCEIDRFTSKSGKNFKRLKEHNYRANTEDRRQKLLSNLVHTEVDIVIESPSRLYVGEAKFHMGFGTNSKLILVHQLIRQYVMAQILVDIINPPTKKTVIPFIVGDNNRTLQVDFMVEKGWLQTRNILKWECVKELLK